MMSQNRAGESMGMRQKEPTLDGERGQRGREEQTPGLAQGSTSFLEPVGARDHQIPQPSSVSRSSSCSLQMAAQQAK